MKATFRKSFLALLLIYFYHRRHPRLSLSNSPASRPSPTAGPTGGDPVPPQPRPVDTIFRSDTL